MAIIGGEATSPFIPNQLFDVASGQALQRGRMNDLMLQSKQQEIGATDQEMVARASAYIDGLPADQKPTAYASAVRDLQSRGFAMKAPAEYPGDETIKRLATMGTPSKDTLSMGVNRDAAAAYGRSLGLGGAPGPGASAAPTGNIEMPAQQRARLVYDGLIKRGMDADTATAFAANALHESAGNPNTGTGDGGASHGLFMWNGPRLQAYVAKYGHAPDNAPLDEQLDFVTHELAGSEAPAGARISQAQGAADKAAEVSRAYLRPKDTVAEMDRRSATASQLAGLWGSSGQTASAAPGTGGGVAARTGGVDMAGPGVSASGGAAAPATAGMEPLLPSNLTASQAAQVQTRLSMRNPDINAISDDVRAMQQNNLAIRHQAQQDAETAAERTYQRQKDAASAARLAETDRLAQQKADREAAQAAQGHQGTGLENQDINIVEKGDVSSREYAGAYNRMAAPKFLPDGSKIVPDMSAYDPPTFKGAGSEGGMTKAAITPPATVVDGMLGNVQAVRQIDKTLAELDRRKGVGVGIVAGNTPAIVLNRTDPEGVTLRALIADIGSLKLHDRSGAAVSASEAPRLIPFIPSISDPPETVKDKLQKFRNEYLAALNDSYQVYGPRAGGKAMEPVEDALKGYQAGGAPASVPPPPPGFKVIQ
jgi:hypothetical protein